MAYSNNLILQSTSRVAASHESAPTKTKTRNVTPPALALGYTTIVEKIQTGLEALRPVIETFVKNPEPVIWLPPEHIEAGIREYLTNLKIPVYPHNNAPSLLFHRLHLVNPEDIREIDKIIEGRQRLLICNTSGSGKTRRILEMLSTHWGFYFVAAPDGNGVGVGDVSQALDSLLQYREWVPDLDLVPAEERSLVSFINGQIVFKQIGKVFAARIAVFKLFLDVARSVDGGLQEKHKLLWLRFQLSDPKGAAPHPFVSIIEQLERASEEAITQLIKEITQICDDQLRSEAPFIIALDEAQRATRRYPRCSISSEQQHFRSIIRDISKLFTENLSTKLIVSGTGLSLPDLQDAMASGVSKAAPVKQHFELGTFDWPKLDYFLRKYVPGPTLETASWQHLQVRMREYLLGRYRFSVTFIERILVNGLQSPHRILTQYIHAHVGCNPGDTGERFASLEPTLESGINLVGFDWEKLRSDQPAMQEALAIVRSHVTRGQPPTYSVGTVNLVEYGIARLRQDRTMAIEEPLAFLSLMRWLEQQDKLNLATDLRFQAGYENARGGVFEEIMVLYLFRVLRSPVALSSIFQFHTERTPQWADAVVQIVARLDGIDVPVNLVGDQGPQNPSLAVVYYADSVEAIINWLEDLETAPAILIPTILFGPDVLFRARSPSRKILGMGQFKSFVSGNKDTLNAETLGSAITSLTSEHWFKKSAVGDRQRLITAVNKYDVLRFVAGYPLKPNFATKAESVANALRKLDSNATLATIQLDPLIHHFKLPGEHLNVLQPLESALAKRRNSDERLVERSNKRKKEG